MEAESAVMIAFRSILMGAPLITVSASPATSTLPPRSEASTAPPTCVAMPSTSVTPPTSASMMPPLTCVSGATMAALVVAEVVITVPLMEMTPAWFM